MVATSPNGPAGHRVGGDPHAVVADIVDPRASREYVSYRASGAPDARSRPAALSLLRFFAPSLPRGERLYRRLVGILPTLPNLELGDGELNGLGG